MAVSRKRLWKRVVLGVFGLLALLILVAPWIGAPILRSAAVSRLQEALGRTVELDGLDVGWTSGVTVEGLRIFNSSIEFTDSVLLEIKSARLAQPLTDLLFGSDELHLELDEVTLRLEEQAGGRTNFTELHEFLTKFREPRPAPAVVEKPEPPRPVRITLRNCAVTLRRLAPRGKLPSFDSKTGDPEILAAGEGTTVVGVEEFNLDAHLRGSSFSVELSGKTIVDDSHGSIELSLRREGKETHASIHADALDLRALAPLLPFDLEGVVDIEAHGTFLDNRISDIALKSELKGFRMKGEGIPEVREEWIRVEAKAASRKKRLEIESLVALTASKRIEIRGSGSVPLEMEAGETRFGLKGHVPLPLLYGFLDEGAVQGRVDFSLDGSSQDNVLHVSGRIDGSDLALPEADLGAPLPATVKGRLQADIAFEKKTLDLSELTISAEDSVIGVTGRAGWTEGIVVDMAVVENSRLDLGRLFPFIQPYLKLRGSPKLKGRASIKEATVKIARDGHLTLAADLLVRDFDAAGILKRRVRTKRAHLDLEATLLPGWDTIEIKRARLNDISAKGTVEGLKERPKLVEGRVEGTVPLTPVLLDLLELKDVSDIGGSLTLDLKATRADEGATTLTGSASVTDLRLVTTAGTFAQKSLVFTPTLALVDERIKGSGTLKGDDFDLTLKNLDTGTPRSLGAEFKAADLAALVPLLPPGTLPEGLEIAGDATINLLVKGPSFKVSLLSDELTVATKDRGLRRRAFQLEAHVEQAGSRWKIERFYVASPGSPGELTVEKGYVDHLEDAKRREVELSVVFESTVESIRELVPESFRDLESGTVNGNLQITLQDELRVVGKIRGTDLKSKDRTKAKLKGATATLDLVGPRWISEGARPEGATGKFDVNRFDLVVNEEGDDVGRAQVTGNIDFGAEVVANLHLVVDIRMEDITTFYSAIQGEGRVTIDARVKELYDAYTKKVVSRIKGTLQAPDVRVGEIELKEPSGKFNIVSFRQGGTWTEGSSKIDVRSGTLRYGKHVAQGVVVEQKSELQEDVFAGGEELRRSVVLRITSAKIDGEILLSDIRAELAGDFKDALRGGGKPLSARGTITVKEFKAEGFHGTSFEARIGLKGTEATLSELKGSLNGGTVSGSGWVDLGSDPLSWKTDELAATNVLLSKDLGKKLRFVLPIFHMGTGRDGEMSGRLSATITVKGKGTSGEVLKKSLDGHGRITLDTVTVEGSPIMKVLTLQVESLFQGDSFKFDRATVDFKIHKQRVDIPNGVMIEGPSYPIEFKRGTAFFDGTIDFDIAVKRYPIPLKLKGTFDHPKVRLRKPKLSDLFPR